MMYTTYNFRYNEYNDISLSRMEFDDSEGSRDTISKGSFLFSFSFFLRRINLMLQGRRERNDAAVVGQFLDDPTKMFWHASQMAAR